MFAFAIWDSEKKGLLLARDPYGIKPLYYTNTSGTFRFGSQVKALLAGKRVSRDPEPAGWVGFHLFGSIPEPFTSYRDIRALPAGSTLWIDAKGVGTATRYFCLPEIFRKAEERCENLASSELQEHLQLELRDSVRHHMIADVPVGLFLSAGIDSGALLGLMQDVGQGEVESVTLAYEEYRDTHEDEVPLASRCAKHYGSKHTTRMVTAKEFHDDLPRIFEAMDQPTIDGINTWFVSKSAGELGLRAAISGLGGDEIFGGYPSFRDIPRWLRFWAMPARVPFLGDAFRYFAEKTGLANILNPKIAGALKFGSNYAGVYFLRRGLFMPWELSAVMDREVVAAGLQRLDPIRHISEVLEPRPRTNFGKVATLEASIYMRNQLLRDTDWASMAHSLEVRVPLVDAQLVQTIAPALVNLPTGAGKRLLATSPRLPLPAEIAEKSKTGFGTPVADWLLKDSRLQKWRNIPKLAGPRCPWARRWAYQLAAA
jgi:asparagine synthase (glutamine-hydrolysing)